jgi:formate dehydrogenase major subunit
MYDSDCIVVMGSNMAENHPVAFRWPMKAKVEHGAKIIHVDPRFTRTSAVADIYAPVRAGSDIAFLGGVINYVINNERWQTDPFFKTWVVNYTNAATIINEDFKDTEDLNGVFSGLIQYKGGVPEWPFNAFIGQYDGATWQYARTKVGDQGHTAATAQSGEVKAASGSNPVKAPGSPTAPKSGVQPTGKEPVNPPSYMPLVQALVKPPVEKDPTLQNPRCVFQILKRHYSRYTPEMVEKNTGCPKETFLKVARTILDNSGAERTVSFAYAVAWTQHTYGVQIIGCCALLQLLLGNVGRPGAGVMALRGHASIQGSTDVPTLYHSIQGYMAAPTALKKHDTLSDYITAETIPTGYWANMPKFMVSYLKSVYGEAATAENQYGYDWHPKILGDHSHMAMFAAMNAGKVKGMILVGQNPATSLNARLERAAMRKLEWLVVKDNWLTESATYWKGAPEIKNGEVKPADIKTEIFYLPATQVGEIDGTFTNTQRMLQFHHKAAEAPGDCRSDTWFSYELGKRLKKLYANSTLPRDDCWKYVTWDYEHEDAAERKKGEPSVMKINKELNGFFTDDPSRHCVGFAELKDDGSTTCASWIYSGMFPGADKYLPDRRTPDPPGKPGAHLQWGWAWPANRRIMYNRASADPSGQPWSERKKWVWWDAEAKKWVGYDVPDYIATKPPDDKAKPGTAGMDALPGTAPFIMRPDGLGWLFAPSGMVDGPLPTHYEPVESPVKNPLYQQQASPVIKYWKDPANPLAQPNDPKFPHVLTTYRLTEHYLSGAMSRWNPWLTELQPELFIEISPELAQEKGIKNLDMVKISSPRAQIKAKALVTKRMRPFQIDGKTVHQVGMPWHWGYEGLSTGDVVNELTSLVGDPNVSMHEGKALVCNVEKA